MERANRAAPHYHDDDWPAGSRFVAGKYVAPTKRSSSDRDDYREIVALFLLVMCELDGYMLIDSTSESRAAREPVGPEMLGGGKAVI